MKVTVPPSVTAVGAAVTLRVGASSLSLMAPRARRSPSSAGASAVKGSSSTQKYSVSCSSSSSSRVFTVTVASVVPVGIVTSKSAARAVKSVPGVAARLPLWAAVATRTVTASVLAADSRTAKLASLPSSTAAASATESTGSVSLRIVPTAAGSAARRPGLADVRRSLKRSSGSSSSSDSVSTCTVASVWPAGTVTSPAVTAT